MKTFVLFVLVFFALISTYNVNSQVVQEWIKTYAGPIDSGDYGVDAVTDAQGNVYIAAISRGSMSGTDFAVIKYNSAGVQQWSQRYNGPSNSGEVPTAIAIDASGNVYITGRTIASGFNYDYATVKYNSGGVQQWAKIYNGTANGDDQPSDMVVDAAGNVYVTGYSSGTGTNADYATVKYNSSGTEEWVKRFNGSANSNDRPQGISFDNSGNICVTGYSAGTGTGSDCTTIKYSPGGTEIWVKRFSAAGGNTTEFGYALAGDSNGNIYVTGYSVVNFNQDFLLIKYNSAGDTVWTRKYNGPDADTDIAYYIAVHDTNNIYISGTSFGSNTGEDIATVKYNGAGVQQWAARYDGPGGPGLNGSGGNVIRGLQEDFVNDMKLDTEGNLYITGTAYSNNSLHDYLIIKYDAAGTQKWLQLYNGPENEDDGAFSIAIDNNDNVYVTGYAADSVTLLYECITIKYSQPIGIQNISTEIPKGFSLGQNYPNPFNPSTNISFQLSKQAFVKLTVFDISGREIETIISQNLNAGTYKADWNASKYPSGVYFCKMHTDEFTAVKKMVLIK